jgi:hypothetical protein
VAEGFTPVEKGIIALAMGILGRRGGRVRSAKKAQAVRENGKKGGRPLQDPNIPAPTMMAEYQRRHRARVKAAKAVKAK